MFRSQGLERGGRGEGWVLLVLRRELLALPGDFPVRAPPRRRRGVRGRLRSGAVVRELPDPNRGYPAQLLDLAGSKFRIVVEARRSARWMRRCRNGPASSGDALTGNCSAAKPSRTIGWRLFGNRCSAWTWSCEKHTFRMWVVLCRASRSVIANGVWKQGPLSPAKQRGPLKGYPVSGQTHG